LRSLPKVVDPNLLVGTETHDDAGVYRLTEDLAIVQTIDFFPPIVDDPFTYGRIAAANALSDVYAMGGAPRTALNLVGFPDDKESLEWLGEILRGGAERCQAAGAIIIGGHSVRDQEIKYGLAITGTIHPRRIITNATARPGDALVLTKALGTGFVATAHKAGACPDDVYEAACASMIQLNDIGRDLLIEFQANSATDITGFGLAGHAYEMAQASGVTLVLEVSRLPLLPGSQVLARKPFLSRASASNAAYVASALQFEGKPETSRLEFVYDAQTSGGLLISVPSDRAQAVEAAARQRGAEHTRIIGRVIEREGDTALIIRGQDLPAKESS
jgi:selenide,water dikinase